jgi:hypothetical protein
VGSGHRAAAGDVPRPHEGGLAIDRVHGRLFVANLSNNSLDVVGLKAGKLLKQTPT